METPTRTIFERDLAGDIVYVTDPDYHLLNDLMIKTQKILAELNTVHHTDEEVREIFARLTGAPVDPSLCVLRPFFTDYGKNIRVGKGVFINHCCEIMDRGGVTIEDDVLIGPKVNLITINHLQDPARRRATHCAPIVLRRNVWIGAAVSVMPGVTIGENSIIAAGAVVTKDIPPNCVAGGVPARVLREIGPSDRAEAP